ncbi:MAG TPA: YceI family protein [Puia sp.]|nr:YceI family protein [Puia sp.]
MKLLYPIAAALILTASAFTFISAPAPAWTITDKYNIGFSNNDAAGIFRSFHGTIVFDENNPAASRFDVTIDVASINTGNALQNKHAKSDEWFDAAKYPTIHFASTKISKTANGFLVTGDLEMHGVKKSTTIPFTFVHNGNDGAFNGSFNINRSGWNIGKPGGEVAEDIKLDISVPVKK